ncbi:MAG: fluoride efflux transporter CrcB [Armatimonadota bacterium]
MKIVFLLAGGAIGALTRYWVSLLSVRLFGTGFPTGTLIVNLAGCLLIGLVFGVGEQKGISPAFRLFFITGFLGALTTFSAYGLETVNNASNGAMNIALINIALNNIGGLLLIKAGLMISKFI